MSDLLVIGGGVVGLSIAYEMAGRGRRVRLIDASQPGREASWAGAGILPPAGAENADPLEQLAALSNHVHARWSEELRAETGIDNGFRRTGAIYVARDTATAQQLELLASFARTRNIVAQRLATDELAEIEPALRPSGQLHSAYFVPAECQIRNPRHLKALLAGCARRGVEITPGARAEDFDVGSGSVRAVVTGAGRFAADQVCITTGAWSRSLAARLDVELAIKPVRGQIALLSLARPLVSHIINEGSRYLVPRPDGRLLVGSTEEDAGFDRSTTAQGIGGLLQFALALVPELANVPLERTWAGLRPSTEDGLPYLGRVPGLDNAFMAAGHFRGGLQLSTGTAMVLSALLEGQPSEIDLTPFRLDRHAAPGAAADRPRRARSLQ